MDTFWVDDDAALVVLEELGIKAENVTISVDSINKQLSKQNRARRIYLDDSRIDGLKASMKKGVPIPRIVVRSTADGYVIAGGNHRFASINGAATIPVHVIDCTDAEFEVAVRMLNTVVGQGMTKEERLESAADAVERLGFTQNVAEALYGLGKKELSNWMLNKKLEQRLEALVPARLRSKFKRTHLKKMGELGNNENILRAAVNCVAQRNLTADEVGDLATIARTKGTEAAQIGVFEDEAVLKSSKQTVVPRRKKKAFLTALTQVRKFAKTTTWQSIEIEREEIPVLKKQVKEAIGILNNLLKDNG